MEDSLRNQYQDILNSLPSTLTDSLVEELRAKIELFLNKNDIKMDYKIVAFYELGRVIIEPTTNTDKLVMRGILA